MKNIFFLFMVVCLSTTYGQQIPRHVIASGGQGGLHTFTLGDLAVSDVNNTQYGIHQGFHKGVQIISSANEEFQHLLQVFPNPTSQQVCIKSKEYSHGQVLIYDLTGKILYSKELTSIYTEHDIEHFPAGTYKLYIRQNQRVIHSSTLLKF